MAVALDCFDQTRRRVRSSPFASPNNLIQPLMHQVETYVTWINSQLEKRPNSRKVCDLSKDMRDGVIFLQLVEVIGEGQQQIINTPNLSLSEMRANINSVLEFLAKSNVRMHHIIPKDIVEGNLKAVMRLVLALAAHFKPEPFKYHTFHNCAPSSAQKLQRTPSVMSLASDAAASLAQASKNASSAGMSLHYKYRNRPHFSSQTSTPNNQSSPISSRRLKPYRLDNNEIPDNPRSPRRSLVEFSSGNKNSPSSNSPMQTKDRTPSKVKRVLLQDEIEDDGIKQIVFMHDAMLEDLESTKEVLLQLQNMLFSGRTPEEKTGLKSPKDDSFQEQLITRNIMLDQKEEECQDLKFQMNEFKELSMKWNGEKTGLELRLSQQEQLILNLKSKLLKYEISKKSSSELELETLLAERVKELNLLHQELTKRDDIIEKQKSEINSLSSDVVRKAKTEANLHAKLEGSESLVSSLNMQVNELTERMHAFPLDDKSFIKDRMPFVMKINGVKFQKDKQKISREHSNIRVTLANIRRHFKTEDPVQHAFESIGQSLASLSDTFNLMGTNVQYKEVKIPTKPCSSNNVRSSASSDSGYDINGNISLDTCEQVKILYFLGKSITPILKTTDIRLGFFSLRYFKQIVNRPGKFRYFFKSVDKDFGFVREELLFDDDIVPGHENKIVAWLEKNLVEDV